MYRIEQKYISRTGHEHTLVERVLNRSDIESAKNRISDQLVKEDGQPISKQVVYHL